MKADNEHRKNFDFWQKGGFAKKKVDFFVKKIYTSIIIKSLMPVIITWRKLSKFLYVSSFALIVYYLCQELFIWYILLGLWQRLRPHFIAQHPRHTIWCENREAVDTRRVNAIKNLTLIWLLG